MVIALLRGRRTLLIRTHEVNPTAPLIIGIGDSEGTFRQANFLHLEVGS